MSCSGGRLFREEFDEAEKVCDKVSVCSVGKSGDSYVGQGKRLQILARGCRVRAACRSLRPM